MWPFVPPSRLPSRQEILLQQILDCLELMLQHQGLLARGGSRSSTAPQEPAQRPRKLTGRDIHVVTRETLLEQERAAASAKDWMVVHPPPTPAFPSLTGDEIIDFFQTGFQPSPQSPGEDPADPARSPDRAPTTSPSPSAAPAPSPPAPPPLRGPSTASPGTSPGGTPPTEE
jgi:hypothetical protein